MSASTQGVRPERDRDRLYKEQEAATGSELVTLSDTDAPATARQNAGLNLLLRIAEGAATGPLPYYVPRPSPPQEPDVVATPAERARRAGRHKRRERHLARLALFAAIGGCMFLGGLALQIALVRGVHMDVTAAYFVSGFASIQVSYLLNRYLTWRDKAVGFWAAWWKFNVQKAGITVVNVAL